MYESISHAFGDGLVPQIKAGVSPCDSQCCSTTNPQVVLFNGVGLDLCKVIVSGRIRKQPANLAEIPNVNNGGKDIVRASFRQEFGSAANSILFGISLFAEEHQCIYCQKR